VSTTTDYVSSVSLLSTVDFCYRGYTKLHRKLFMIKFIKKIINHVKFFYKGVDIDSPKNVTIGENVYIGKNVNIRGRGGVVIGDNVVIAFNTIILSANHNYKTGIPFGDDYILKPTIIGKGCWIGAGVIILPGVTIGDNVVVGAGTIVNQDIPDNAIICNDTKIKIIKYRKNAQ